VHGGVGPEITWERQEPLAERFTLVIPWRRGYEPSPPAPCQDFEADAADLLPILEPEPAHLVGFSYGGLGALLATATRPERVRSLILIETPVWRVAADDPAVRSLIELSERFTSQDAEASPAVHEEFLALAGLGDLSSQEIAQEAARATRLARGLRSPGEADPDFAAITGAGIPCAVFSGGHSPGIERLCDALAARLGAERQTVPGAGHAVQRADGFNARLERFLASA
jgi:pimeloyl-ACP methyl ester carboxylesterase